METGGGAEEGRGVTRSGYPPSSSLSATTNMHANTHVDPTLQLPLVLSSAPC